jgi:hypothetical protein
MEFEETPLYEDAQRVIAANQVGAKRTVRCIIHLDEGVLITEPLFVTAVNILRDYKNNYADNITVSTIMGLGQYVRKVYPARNNLKITMTFTPLDEKAAAVSGELVYSQKYHAILIEQPGMPTTVGSGAENTNEDSLNTKSIVDVHFQLIEESVYQLRVASVAGIFRNQQLEPLIKVLISQTGASANVDSKQALNQLDVLELDNQKKYNQILIPSGIKMVDLPEYLQKYYGLYNSGLGSYIFRNTWYIYPMYRFVSLNDSLKTLSFIVMPKSKFREIENTFLVKGDSTTILVTGDTKFMSLNSLGSLEYGTGVRYLDADTAMDSPTTENNKATISRQKRVAEYSAFESENKLVNIRHADDRITANPFFQNSNIAETMGSYYDCQWGNCDPTLIYPGVPCNVMYFEYDKVVNIKGVVVAAKYHSLKVSDPTSSMHTTTGMVRIFLEDFNRALKPEKDW